MKNEKLPINRWANGLFMFISFLLLLPTRSTYGQYFGRNKPRYMVDNVRVVQSPNFEMYHYLRSDDAAKRLVDLHEWWYRKHQAIFRDTIPFRNPIIFYNHHADFQQTNAIQDFIGVGTGGVTEGLKNRVVMPFLETNRQTSHVIGHELVHAFQFNMLLRGDSASRYSLNNIPLWMIEGMAEYMSLGRKDAHTAMWMRDALLHNNFPSLEQMTLDSRFFPYRFGQAFWAYATGIWGDQTMRPLLEATAQVGYKDAIKAIFQQDEPMFSERWKLHMSDYYLPFAADTTERVGRRFFGPENAGNINISPVYSPDAQYMAFISEKDALTVDIYLVHVKSRRIVRKLSDGLLKSHIDDFNYIESVGTFSPDSRYFAFTVFSKGRNMLLVVDVRSGKTIREIFIPGLDSFNNPSWSPDGQYIVVSGLSEGQSDLYLYDYKNGTTQQLTDDRYSEIQPAWSPDGNHLVFVSDRGSDTDFDTFQYGSYRICLMEMRSGEIEVLNLFPGADNMNPQYSADGHMIYFLSDAHGFRDLYEYSTVTGDVFRLTRYFTGISGITSLSPALTVARDNGLLAYSLYRNGKYHIYMADPADFGYVREKVHPLKTSREAAILPPPHSLPIVNNAQLIQGLEKTYRPLPDSAIAPVRYRPKFKLDYIGNTGNVSIAAGRFSTSLAGGVNTLFSDILGNHQLFGALSLNGEIFDLGLQTAYINRKRPLSWGITLSHVPYQSGHSYFYRDTLTIQDTRVPVDNQALYLLRTYETQGGVFTYRPFSQTRRLEAGAVLTRYHYRLDRRSYYYYQGLPIGEEKERLPAPRGFTTAQINAAFVGDNTVFGTVGPLKGSRFRFEIEQYLGSANFRGFLADYRHYLRVKPLTLATRFYHYGRYAKASDEAQLPPLFLGYPTLIRGFTGRSFDHFRAQGAGDDFINRLSGSRLLVANAEIRLPLTGPERLSLIKSGFLLSELNFFLDGGTAWRAVDTGEKRRKIFDTDHFQPIGSAGVSLRVNLLGYLIIEPYYAFPWQRKLSTGVFGLNFTQAW